MRLDIFYTHIILELLIIIKVYADVISVSAGCSARTQERWQTLVEVNINY
jgi:hypothetical protein